MAPQRGVLVMPYQGKGSKPSKGRSSVGEDIRSAKVEPWGRRVLPAEGNKSPSGREKKGIN